ncbi:MAG: histidine kinase [Bacteroidetes bacterium]|jgi:signal transduction histidine kinase/DNA-binding response OmpR family regulator|nr:histidine kinase [Bacteroidota bacterium]
MKMTLGQKILSGFIICGIILCGVAVFTFNNSEKFIASNAWVDHTNRVISELQQVQLSVVDAETGARGYVISGNDNFLEPYTNAKIKIFENLNNTKELTADNEAQQKRLEELEKEINRYTDYLTKLLEIRKTDPAKASSIVTSGEGKRITDSIRKIIAAAREVEQGLLRERKKESDDDARNFNLVFAVLLAVILVILISVYFIIITNLRALRRAEAETADKNWLLTGNSLLNDQTHGEKEVTELAKDVMGQIVPYMKAQIGTLYLLEDDHLYMTGGYAIDLSKGQPPVKVGQGLLGQAAREKKPVHLEQVPNDYMKINSTLGNTLPKHVLVFPFQYAGKVKGVIEIGSVTAFSELSMQFLQMIAENLGIAFNSSQSRAKLKELLEETQAQSEELQSQQEELRQLNEELEEHTQNLKQQQEELQMTNEELEEQTRSLEMKNKEVELARYDIEQKTKQLEVSSRYKSEFLANMSHELRTPLNSLLILSKELADNRIQNLNRDQVESAEIIYNSGQDLLVLINEVLDLSKIEAGKMDVNIEEINLKAFSDNLVREFKHQADQKKLQLVSKLDPDLPVSISSDPQRLNQVMKNLLSNALKFTEKGSITIGISRYSADKVSINVTDTGIGIPAEKQMAVFEAFQQADGGTSRKYGGTGLGLSISRELAKLLGTEIRLSSKVNEGSTFSLIVPLTINPTEGMRNKEEEKIQYNRSSAKSNQYIDYPAAPDNRDSITTDDKVVLIIEDDLTFASVLMKQATQKGFKCISAATGEDGLLLAEKYKPTAIVLDIDLPGIDGHSVLAALKSKPALRHIPVHIMSVNERTIEPIKEGAIEYLMKPVTKNDLEEAFNRIENFVNRKMKNLLIIEDDDNARKAMRKLIGNGDVKCYEAATGAEALKLHRETYFDCIVLDLGLPDMTGFELIYQLEREKGHIPPIIIYTGKELTKEENLELQKYTESIIIKGVKSEERLLDETALFLHRTISNLPESKQSIINRLYDKEAAFQGKRVLLVDDDMRNIFALSKVLKERGMEVIKADNGINSLEMLEQHKSIDIVLMDIMMPEMDGYEAMRRIRAQEKFRQLPVIALTAKAMKDDKQKCIDAGANDYITKPVDVERLLSLMRVWLSK